MSTEWVLYLPPVGEAEVYLFDSTHLLSQQRSGRYVRASEKPANKGPDVHVPLTLAPDRTYDLLMRVRSLDHEPISLAPKLYRLAHWNQLELEPRRPLILFFQGVFWIMLIYNLVLYFSVKFDGYLYYALYLLSLSLFVSVAVGELTHPAWGNPRVWRVLGFLAFGTINVCYFQFGRVLLGLREALPRWDRFLRSYVRGKLIVLLLIQAETLARFNVALTLQIEFALFFLEVVISLALFVALLRHHRNRVSYYFIAGSGSVIVPSVPVEVISAPVTYWYCPSAAIATSMLVPAGMSSTGVSCFCPHGPRRRRGMTMSPAVAPALVLCAE